VVKYANPTDREDEPHNREKLINLLAGMVLDTNGHQKETAAPKLPLDFLRKTSLEGFRWLR
jgi:hypothetical protein